MGIDIHHNCNDIVYRYTYIYIRIPNTCCFSQRFIILGFGSQINNKMCIHFVKPYLSLTTGVIIKFNQTMLNVVQYMELSAVVIIGKK